MKRSLKRIALALMAIVTPCFAWADVVYTNSLAGTDRSLTLGEKTYQATAFTASTDLSSMSSTADSTLAGWGGIFQPATYIATHSVSGWFKVEAERSATIVLWAANNNYASLGGYSVQLTSAGAIQMGRTTANDGSTFESGNSVATADNVIADGNWHFIAMSFSWATGNKLTPLLYVDGNAVAFSDTTKTITCGLNGPQSCTNFKIGAGVTAAGVKVYNEAIAADAVATDYADRTNLTEAPTATATTISAETATVSGLTWDNGTPSADLDATITAETATTLTMDAELKAAMLTINGEKVTFAGDQTLTAATAAINTDVDASAISASLGDVALAAGKTLTLNTPNAVTSVSSADNTSTVYYVGEYSATSSDMLSPTKGAVQRYKNLTTTGQIQSDVNVIIGEGDTAVLASRQSYNFTLDGGKVSTTNAGEFWLGGGSKTITVNSGVMDVTSVTSDSGSSAFILSWTGTGGPWVINGGVVDAANTSIAAWQSDTTLAINGGFLRSKGFRSNGNAIKSININGGTVEIGATGMQSSNLPNIYSGGAPVMSGTLRAIDDATVNVNLWSDSTGSFQAVDGKTLTISSTFKGASSYTIGATDGKAKTQTRADDGTYSETDIEVNGTVKLSGASFENAKTFTVKSGTLDLTAYDAVPANLTVTLDGGTVLMKAGAESGLTVPNGSTLKLVVSPSQIAAGYTSTVASGSVTFVKEDGTVITENVNGNTINPSAIKWIGADGGAWDVGTNWEGGVVPAAENSVVFDLTSDLTVTIPEDGATVNLLTVNGAKLTLAGGKLTATDLVVASALEAPVSCIECPDVDLDDEATLTLDAGTTDIDRTMQITGGTVVKKGTALLTLFPTVANVDGAIFDGTTVQITEGVLKLERTDAAGDPWIKDTTFNFANGTELQQYGWIHASGTITLHAEDGVTASAFNSNLTESSTLKKTGAGTVAITVSNYPGAVNVEGGTLVHNGGTLSGTVTTNANTTLEFIGNATIENTSNRIGGLLKVTSGTVTHNGADRGLNSIEIAEGAQLTSSAADGLNYGATTTATINGTLHLKNRWTIFAGNAFYLSGTLASDDNDFGNYYCAFDFYNNANNDNSHTKLYVTGPNAQITGRWGAHDSSKTLDVVFNSNDAKLTISKAPTASQHVTTMLGESVTGGALAVNFEVETEKLLTIASGVALSGTGSWGGPVTLKDGATIDASAGKVTIGDDVTAEGTVTVTCTAAEGTEVLACANAGDLDLTKFVVPTGFKCVAVDGVIKLATAAVYVCTGNSGTSYTSVAEAIEANETTITLIDNTTETVTLPAGVTLVAGEFSVTVQDEYGTNLTADESGNYVCPTYVATASGWGLDLTGYTSLQGAVDAALGLMGTVTLLADLEINAPITINNNEAWFTIDLGGKTLTATGSSAIYVKDGNVTIQNGTINATGVGIWICDKVMSADVAPFDFESNETGNASVTLDSTLTVTSSADNCVLMYNGAVLSTAAKLTSSGEYATIQGTGLNANNATMITITGGSVTSTNNHAIYHPQPGTLTITDGEIKGVTGIEMRAGTLVMEGGTVTATGAYAEPDANNSGSTVTGAAIVLSQHTTGEEVYAAIAGGTVTCAEDGKTLVVANTTAADPVSVFAAINTVDDAVTIDTTKVEVLIPTLMTVTNDSGFFVTAVVATIGETKYPSLPLAFAVANANETADEITIAAGAFIELDAAIEVTTEVTLNLNNAIIRMTEEDTDGNGVFYVTAGGDLTIDGDGVIAAVAYGEDENGDLVYGNNYHMAVWADGGKVTINGGIYNNLDARHEDGATSDHFDLIYVKNGGAIVINGGHFVCETPKWTLNSNDTSTGTITVKGGTFVEYDPAKIETEPKSPGITSWVADGYYTYAEEVTKGETTATWYYVEKATVPETMDKINFSDAAKAALIDAAVEAKRSITSVVAGDGQDAATIDAALALFDDIVTVDTTTGEAKVDWDFGISDIKVNRYEDGTLTGFVDIMATVKKGDDNADYAAGVKVVLVDTANADEEIDTSSITVSLADGVATFKDVKISDLQGKKLKAKVKNNN